MTIHKAKGLEFDSVIVPGPGQGPGLGRPAAVPVEGAGGRRRPAARADQADRRRRDPAYSYLARLDTEAEDIEAARLLYVAATRAKKKLHLLACLERDAHGDIGKPRARSLLEQIAWPLAAPHFAVLEAALPPARTRAGRPVPPPHAVRRRDTARGALDRAAGGRAEEQIEFSWAAKTARHVGTVVHRWLQRIAEDEMKGWDARRIASLKGHFLLDLERCGVPSKELKPSAARVAEALDKTLADERGRWLLGPQNEARTEYRLRTAARATYIVDRSFRDASGELWVVDWKTSRHEGRDLEGFLASEQARYAPQLERYAAALGATRLGLYFPALARWREWTREKG